MEFAIAPHPRNRKKRPPQQSLRQKTLFEMRAGLPKKEPKMLKDWDEQRTMSMSR